ncbi:O-antigen polymerase [Ureibacillus thermosphaericus]|uniref:O-antigen polymerase n=1 Tax=Ureibacillus thermosphaericus TaxID=51173 RepID=UPI0003132F35|nr:O-antigen polymerase [Ureibacillus thermosphaericus]
MKKKNIVTIIMLLAFKTVLELSYIFFVHKIYSYNGFYLDLAIDKFILSLILSFIIIFIIVKYISNHNKASQIILYIILIFLYLPIVSLYWMQNKSTIFILGITLSFLIIMGVSIIFPRVKIVILKKREAKYLFIFIVTLMTTVVYGLLISNGGLSRINLNLLNVYDTRAAYVQNTNIILNYSLSWQAHVINLILLSLALYNRKYFYAFIVLGMQIFLFSMTNFKSHLLAPLVILFFYFFQKTKWKNYFLLIMSIGSTTLVSLSLVLYKISEDLILIPSMFIRRLFFVPAQLHFQYFEFFEDKSKFLLSHSIFEGIIQTDYNVSPTQYMAKEYFNKDFSPNVGFFGDAYVNFGLVGLIVFAIFLGIIMLLIDSFSTKIPLFLTMAILVIPAMSLVNSAFLTTLLTHGVLLSLLMLWVVNGLFNKN